MESYYMIKAPWHWTSRSRVNSSCEPVKQADPPRRSCKESLNKCKSKQRKAWTQTPFYLSQFLPEFLPLSYAFPPLLFLLQSVPGLCPQLVVLQDFADFFAAFAVVSVLLLVIFLAALWKLNSRFSSLIFSPQGKNEILSMINSALNNLQKMLRGWVQTTFCLSCVTWNVHYVDSTTPTRTANFREHFRLLPMFNISNTFSLLEEDSWTLILRRFFFCL